MQQRNHSHQHQHAGHHHGHQHGQMPQTIDVYGSGFANVLSVASRDIRHMPAAAPNVSRLVLCTNYNDAVGPQSCPMGHRCKFVHADLRRAVERQIHVNYAWRKLEDVKYARFDAGDSLHVAAPNSKVPTDVMDSDMVLRTKALVSKRRPLSHCAHYYFNRTCNLGAECQFIHAVFIDPAAKDHQRAPVPSVLGEGRELQLSKRQREAKQREAHEQVTSAVSRATPPQLPIPSVAPHPHPAGDRGYAWRERSNAAASGEKNFRFDDSLALTSSLPKHRSSAASLHHDDDDRRVSEEDDHHSDHHHRSGSCTPRRHNPRAGGADAHDDDSSENDTECLRRSADALSHGTSTRASSRHSDSMFAASPASASSAAFAAKKRVGPTYRHDPYSLVSSRVVMIGHSANDLTA